MGGKLFELRACPALPPVREAFLRLDRVVCAGCAVWSSRVRGALRGLQTVLP